MRYFMKRADRCPVCGCSGQIDAVQPADTVDNQEITYYNNYAGIDSNGTPVYNKFMTYYF